MEKNNYYDYLDEIGQVEKENVIQEKIGKILEKSYQSNLNKDVLSEIHGCIDLTSLTSLDTKQSIWEMVEKVNMFEGTTDIPNIAAICTHPIFVETVKQALLAKDVKIVSVAGGFPSSQTFPEIKIAETAMAVMTGADEIDVVINLGLLLENAEEELIEELSEIKEACREAKLKVIIETGALQTTDLIRKATLLAICSGADFVKTSTGKDYPGATPEAVYIICDTIKKYEAITSRKIGIKISGGVRTASDAVKYYTIVKEVLGKDWVNKELFRIGASKLVDDIQKKLAE